jgi:small subunit ribosomal protein S11
MAAESAAEKAKGFVGLENVSVFVKGVGPGREQAIRGLHTSKLNILSIVDLTAIPHNGCRKKKPRRV